ncbi:MAG: hypothetical protein RRY18_00055 [Clostridia bacterium]
MKTISLSGNVSKFERFENIRLGRQKGENISYAYPKNFEGKRSALGKEIKDYSYVDGDRKQLIIF